MAEETPSLHIDTDWKKQAQEEKRRLAEQEQKRAQQQQEQRRAGTAPGASPVGRPAARGAGGARELPAPSFASLVQSLLTQALYYLGELAPQGTEPQINLDMAKHHVDTLGILEDKTRNNLNEDEQRLLDTALYESRNRYVNVASQFI